jgi:outer membrane protein assembly factor BamB
MASDPRDGLGVCSSTGLESPSITSVSMGYTYTQADQHYNSGVVISDGVSYVGSFTQPGNRGHFYAIAAGDGTKYFDAASRI